MLNDELSDLVLFAAVADARSFTRAAAKLGISITLTGATPRRRSLRFWKNCGPTLINKGS